MGVLISPLFVQINDDICQSHASLESTGLALRSGLCLSVVKADWRLMSSTHVWCRIRGGQDVSSMSWVINSVAFNLALNTALNTVGQRQDAKYGRGVRVFKLRAVELKSSLQERSVGDIVMMEKINKQRGEEGIYSQR